MAIFHKSTVAQLHNAVMNWRKTAGITQLQLAEQVGVSRQTIIALEKGNYVPSLVLAIKIARYFRTSVEDIFIYE